MSSEIKYHRGVTIKFNSIHNVFSISVFGVDFTRDSIKELIQIIDDIADLTSTYKDTCTKEIMK